MEDLFLMLELIVLGGGLGGGGIVDLADNRFKYASKLEILAATPLALAANSSDFAVSLR